MKRFYKVIAVILILSTFMTVAFASPVIDGIYVHSREIRIWTDELHYRATPYTPITISQRGTLIILGNLYIEEWAQIHIDGNIFVAGRIIGDRSLVTGSNARALNPVCQGVARWLLGGWILNLFVCLLHLLAWILT